MKNKITLKRLGAYIIDLFLIYLVSYFLTNSNINPQRKDYESAYEAYYYSDLVSEYNKFTSKMGDLYSSSTITKEDYSKIATNSEYNDLVSSQYITSGISSDIYTKIINKASDIYVAKVKNKIYILDYNSLFYNIITLVLTVLYFSLFPLFTSGQTLGYKIMKLKLISKTKNKLYYWNYLLRAVILYNVIFTLLGMIAVRYLGSNNYYTFNYINVLLMSIVTWVSIFLIITREDNCGLHDLIARTKVVSEKEKTVEKSVEIIEKGQKSKDLLHK